MQLRDTVLRNTKPREKPFKLSDGQGLYVLINKTGKYFRYDYRFAGKRKTLALGVYPNTSLAEAREKHSSARKLLQQGIDPSKNKKLEKITQQEKASNSFESIAREWHTKQKERWSPKTAINAIRRLEANVFPWIREKSVTEIIAPEILLLLQRIESRGATDTAHRVKFLCSQVFRYAIATCRAERDPTADLRGALQPVKSKNRAAITDTKQIGGLLRAIDGYEGHIITQCALQLAPLTFVRPGELRHAEWSEIDFDKAEWKIPAKKMKMDIAHIIPLSRQAIQILEKVAPVTDSDKYVFPSLRSTDRPMSDNTILAALRRMGYDREEMSGHGFRGMASTLLHENGWDSEVIERQLAHKERNKVKAAYNHAQHLSKRREMMQWWADYLDSLKEG